MIISRTPFRISLVGGGTDFPDYYKYKGGKVIGFAIDKYCNIFFREGNNLMDYNFRIAYSKIELSKTIENIDHPSVRNTSKYFNIKNPYDILHNGDLPAKTGLGSSSSFTVGLCNIFRTYKKKYKDPYVLAKDAIHIEQKLSKEAVGSQDQIFAAFGGLNTIQFDQNDFYVTRHFLTEKKMRQIKENFLLMYTGITRYAETIEKTKIKKIKNNINNYDSIKELVDIMEHELKSGKKLNLKEIGKILDDAWNLKRKLTKKVSNSHINKLYDDALSYGAYGGKLLGAGGGGFYLFIVPSNKIINFKNKFKKFKFIDFNVSNVGSHIV